MSDCKKGRVLRTTEDAEVDVHPAPEDIAKLKLEEKHTHWGSKKKRTLCTDENENTADDNGGSSLFFSIQRLYSALFYIVRWLFLDVHINEDVLSGDGSFWFE